MALYEVVFNKHEKFSSDVNVGTNPTPTSTVVAPLYQGDVARVEADSPGDAETAVRVAYNGSTSDVDVTVVVEIQAESAVEPTAEPVEAQQTEPVVA